MSDSNNIVILESRIEELQTENNKLKTYIKLLNKTIEDMLTLSNSQLSNDTLKLIIDTTFRLTK